MLDQDEGHAGVGRERIEQLVEGFEAASRGAEPDHQEALSCGWRGRFRDECWLDGGRAAAVFCLPCPFIVMQARPSASHKDVFRNRYAIHPNLARGLPSPSHRV